MKNEARITGYFLVMMLGIILSTYVTHSITIVWLVNLTGFFVFFLPNIRYFNRWVLFVSLGFLFLSFFTLLLNQQFLTDAKSIGTNANILVLPLMLNLAVMMPKLGRESIRKIFSFLSVLGIIAVLVSWVTGFADILSVFRGMNAYQASVAGLFYSKNIYGAFVSLTIAADLYLLNLKKSKARLFIIALKFLAVVLSLSRASLLQCVLMVFLYIFFKKKYSMKEYLAIFALFGLAMFAALKITSNPQWVSFFMNSVFRVHAGDAGRSYLRKTALSSFGFTPLRILFGVGFAGMSQLNMDIDNTYLYLLFTGGIYKILIFAGCLVFSFMKIMELRKKDAILFALCLAVMLSYLVFAFFESVAVLELGLLNFLFTLFLFLLPCAYKEEL